MQSRVYQLVRKETREFLHSPRTEMFNYPPFPVDSGRARHMDGVVLKCCERVGWLRERLNMNCGPAEPDVSRLENVSDTKF